jgi:uncharacterized protein
MDIQKSIRPPHGISAYTHCSITVDDKIYAQSLLLGHAILEPQFGGFDISFEAWEKLPLDTCELVIIGVEGGVSQLPMNWRLFFANKHIGLEVMSVGAACRTFNILLEEGRQVFAWFVFDEKA